MEGNGENDYITVQDYNIVFVVSVMDSYSEEKRFNLKRVYLLKGNLNYYFFYIYLFVRLLSIFLPLKDNQKATLTTLKYFKCCNR